MYHRLQYLLPCESVKNCQRSCRGQENFLISMSNRGLMHGGRCLFNGTYFVIELHTQKLYECDFKLIFYCKMSRVVPRKKSQKYMSASKPCYLSYKRRLFNSTHYFAYALTSLMLILKQEFSPNNNGTRQQTRKNSVDSSTVICDITQKDWTVAYYLTIRRFFIRKKRLSLRVAGDRVLFNYRIIFSVTNYFHNDSSANMDYSPILTLDR